MSWLARLRLIKDEIDARQRTPAPPPRVPDPWEARLADLNGDVDNDGYERIATYLAFDHLGLRRCERSSGTARRLARAMRQIGWQTARFRVAPGSYQRVRGFQRAIQARDAPCISGNDDD